jgi:signal transduction histidine kinase
MSTVLLVDDSPSDRAIFRRILSDGGHTVHELSEGAKVLGRIRELRPHVIVLDVNLPDTDGHEVCREIRRDPLMTAIPVLMLTVRDHRADVIAGLNAGADDYVAKDEAGEIILARVNRLADYRKLSAVAVLNEQLAQIGRLLAGIVHEIRAPLSVIRGHAELMQFMLADNIQVQEYVEPILRNALILQSRLDHLMAAVRTGPSSRALIDVGPVVREAADFFEKGLDPRINRARLIVETCEVPATVFVDAGRLLQVLLNLMANAQEAMAGSEKGSTVHVKVSIDRQAEADWVLIEVTDDGPGIPVDHLHRIFEPFYTTKAEGTGYGLYLAHEIVVEQSGRLIASNLPGGGACFRVCLPLANEAAVPPSTT